MAGDSEKGSDGSGMEWPTWEELTSVDGRQSAEGCSVARSRGDLRAEMTDAKEMACEEILD